MADLTINRACVFLIFLTGDTLGRYCSKIELELQLLFFEPCLGPSKYGTISILNMRLI